METSPEVLTLSDSEEEIFIGPVTDREKEKARKLSRRTQVFFPPISWKLRSSKHSIKESKEFSVYHQSPSLIRNESTGLKSVKSLCEEKVLPSLSCDDMKQTSQLKKPDSSGESTSDGYNEVFLAEKSNSPVTELDSLEYGCSADSLNSLSRDSLDVDHDSLEKNNKEEVRDSSIVEDLYDAGEYVNIDQVKHDLSVPAARHPFTSDEMEELQKQLDRFALDLGKDGGQESLEKHNNSFEIEDITSESERPVFHQNIEPVLAKNQGLPSPYCLKKQKLSAFQPDDAIDFSIERKSKDRLDTVDDVSIPSSTDCKSAPPSPQDFPSDPTDYLPNSTQFFEQLEMQLQEEESNQQSTSTGLWECESTRDATYNVLSNAAPDISSSDHPPRPPFDGNTDAESLNSSYQDSPRHNASGDSCPEGVFNDTLEEMEMLFKYGVDYIYGKNGKTREKEAPPQEIEPQDYRPKSADCCGSQQSESFSSRLKAKAGKAKTVKTPTPVKRTPLTPSNAQVKTPIYSKPSGGTTPTSSKTPGRTGSASNPGQGLQSSATRPTTSWKNVQEKTPKFKIPVVSASRLPRTQGAAATNYSPRPNKFLNQIQSPIGAYIHNSPSPVLMTNVKAKTCTSSAPRDHKKRHPHVWDSKTVDSRNHKLEGSENVNPNVGHGLRTVHYIQAPCVKLDEPSLPKSRLPRLGDRFEKLVDSPCPQVIKHEGRVRVNPWSPQYTAAVKAVRSNPNDSTRCETAGDISVCVTKVAKRTNTLSVQH